MTLFISIFSILMVILANHPTDSGAVPKSNLQEEVLTEVRLQRSLVEGHMKPSTRIRKVGKNIKIPKRTRKSLKRTSKILQRNRQGSLKEKAANLQRKLSLQRGNSWVEESLIPTLNSEPATTWTWWRLGTGRGQTLTASQETNLFSRFDLSSSKH